MLNTTLPVGVPVPEAGATQAVKFTEFPTNWGSALAVKAVAEAVRTGAVPKLNWATNAVLYAEL